MKRHVNILVIIILSLNSCDNYTPAEFWLDYKRHNLKKENIYTSPWGGDRMLHWVASYNDKFNTKEVLAFAYKNNWVLVDSINYTTEDLFEWTDKEKLIFPAILTGFKPNERDSSSYQDFPRLIAKDLSLYIFRTEWLIVYPDTDDATQNTGFILISKDKKEMTMYHLWGG